MNGTTGTSLFVILFHASNLMAFLAFLLRDQLHLRVLMAISLVLQGLYYYVIPGGPLYDPLFWKVVSFAANFLMIFLVFGGRLDFGIPNDLRGLFEKINVLSPGQFRKLIAGTQRSSADTEPLLVKGARPTKLHYLLQGNADIIKGKLSAHIDANVFLGEIAFLNGSEATATVVLREGAECISWDSAALKNLMRKDKAIEIALRGVFNTDLANKVQNSMPIKAIPEHEAV